MGVGQSLAIQVGRGEGLNWQIGGKRLNGLRSDVMPDLHVLLTFI